MVGTGTTNLNSSIGAHVINELNKPFLAKVLNRLPQFIRYVCVRRIETPKMCLKWVDLSQSENFAHLPILLDEFTEFGVPGPPHDGHIAKSITLAPGVVIGNGTVRIVGRTTPPKGATL